MDRCYCLRSKGSTRTWQRLCSAEMHLGASIQSMRGAIGHSRSPCAKSCSTGAAASGHARRRSGPSSSHYANNYGSICTRSGAQANEKPGVFEEPPRSFEPSLVVISSQKTAARRDTDGFRYHPAQLKTPPDARHGSLRRMPLRAFRNCFDVDLLHHQAARETKRILAEALP
jgi:hypothetical protein